jgi:hypothetical protein
LELGDFGGGGDRVVVGVLGGFGLAVSHRGWGWGGWGGVVVCCGG